MRELTQSEVIQVSGAGRVADSLSVVGQSIGGTLGKIIDSAAGGIPFVSSISGVLGVFGLSLGSFGSAMGNIIGYSAGRVSEIAYSVFSELRK